MAAAKTAMADGGLEKENVDGHRFGVLIGSGVGGLETVEESCRILFNKGPRRITPFLLPSIIGNTAGVSDQQIEDGVPTRQHFSL